MGRHCDLPFHIYVNVDNKFLGPDMPHGYTQGIWHGVYSRPHQVLLCHVFLASGAHWSGLPLHALSKTYYFDKKREDLMPWGCMGDDVESYHAKYLEGLECEVVKPMPCKGRHTGIIIDWADGYSRYPEEHKPLNLIDLDGGQFGLLPNNYVLFKDKHFTNDSAKSNMKHYLRGDKIYWEK